MAFNKLSFIVCICTLSCAQQLPQLDGGQIDAASLLKYAEQAERELKYSQCLDYLQLYASTCEHELDVRFWQRQARIAELAKQPQVAVVAREHWLEIDPSDAWIRIDIADDLVRVDEFERAILVLDEGLPLVSEPRVLHEAKIALLERSLMFREAADYCMELAKSSAVELARLYYQKASMLYEACGEIQLAVEAISFALDESSLQDAAANELARLRAFELGQPQNVADARQLLFLHPDESHRLIGIRYLSRGSYKGDVDDFVKALDDESPQVVEIAISMIGQRGSVSDLTIIEKFLGAENKHGHRIASLRAFASLGDSQHAALILSYAEPELRDLFRAWRSCMESLCGYTIGVALDLDLEQRRALVEQWRQYLGG